MLQRARDVYDRMCGSDLMTELGLQFVNCVFCIESSFGVFNFNCNSIE